jgi:hypothetical protein
MNSRSLILPTLILPTLMLTSSLLTLNLLALNVLAFTPEERTNAIIALNDEVAQAEALVVVCAKKYPKTAQANQQALKDWKVRNGLQDFDRVLTNATSKSAAIKATLEQLKAAYVKKVELTPAEKLEPICGNLPSLYADPKYNSIKAERANELEVIAEMARELDAKPATNPAPNTGSGSGTPAATTPITGTAAGPSNSGGKPTPGRYACVYQNQEYSNWAKDPNNPKINVFLKFDFELFANGEYVSYAYKQPLIRIEYSFSNPMDWPEFVGRYKIREGKIEWLNGKFADEYPFYGTNDKVDDKRERRNGSFDNTNGSLLLRWEPEGFSFATTNCKRTGNTQGKTATQLMTEGENLGTYLQPKTVKAPIKPGSGGLNGLYVSSGAQPHFFTPNGWHRGGQFRWGFDQLDCKRTVRKMDVTPLNWRNDLCDPYSLRGKTISIGKESLPFSKTANGQLIIDDREYTAVPANPNKAINAKLSHVWSSTNGTSGAYGEDKLELRSDGKFKYDTSSGGASYFSSGGIDTAVTSSSGNRTDGTYKLFAYSIEFSFNTGLKVRYSFYRDVLLNGSKYDGSYVFLNDSFTPANVK